MKKKLLTIFSVLAVIVAMMLSVVACTKTPTPGPGPVDDDKKDEDVDYSKIASASATAMKDGLMGTLKAALDSSNEKSYDATIFLKVQVGEGEKATNVDVKLRVAATFGTKNSGLLDVIVGGTSYLTLYTAENMVYVGEALTQADKNWFKIDAAKDGKIMDKFFPELLDVLKEKDDAAGETVYTKVNSTIGSISTFIPMIGGLLFLQQKGGIVITDLGNGVTKYENTVTFAKIKEILPLLKGDPFNMDIEEMLSGLGDYQGLIDTVCTIIFGGNLNALLGKDGATIPADAAPDIHLNYTSKNKQLTDLELTYANEIAFDGTKPEEKTAISVAFGLENVNITSNSSTDIMKDTVTTAILNAAQEPAIKVTIAADVPGKDVGATVEAYVVPKATLGATECYSVPTKYQQTYYTDAANTTPQLVTYGATSKTKHKCANDGSCVHVLGDFIDMEKDHACYAGAGYCVHSEFEYGDVKEGHTHLNSKCDHFYNLNKFNFADVEAYAIAKDKNGNAVNVACAVDASELKDDGNGAIVLKFELAGLYELLGIENTKGLPTQYQKTFKMWNDKDEKLPEGEEGEEEGEEEEVENASLLADEETTTITNTIDKVFDAFSGGFEIGKVFGLLNPVLDFAKEIFNDVLKPNMTSDETTKIATLNVANILKGLVANTTIKGSEKLIINSEKNITEYLKNLQGVADLVDNIMRHQKDAKEDAGYTKTELEKLVKDYAGIDITDAAFNNTTLELKGIRGDKTADDGLGFEAVLKSEGKTVLTLTMKVDIVGATTAPGQTVIGSNFNGAELVKVPKQAKDEHGELLFDDNGDPVYEQAVNDKGEPVFDKDGNPVYVEVDGEALENINALAQEILKAYRGDEEAAA